MSAHHFETEQDRAGALPADQRLMAQLMFQQQARPDGYLELQD